MNDFKFDIPQASGMTHKIAKKMFATVLGQKRFCIPQVVTFPPNLVQVKLVDAPGWIIPSVWSLENLNWLEVNASFYASVSDLTNSWKYDAVQRLENSNRVFGRRFESCGFILQHHTNKWQAWGLALPEFLPLGLRHLEAPQIRVDQETANILAQSPSLTSLSVATVESDTVLPTFIVRLKCSILNERVELPPRLEYLSVFNCMDHSLKLPLTLQEFCVMHRWTTRGNTFNHQWPATLTKLEIHDFILHESNFLLPSSLTSIWFAHLLTSPPTNLFPVLKQLVESVDYSLFSLLKPCRLFQHSKTLEVLTLSFTDCVSNKNRPAIELLFVTPTMGSEITFPNLTQLHIIMPYFEDKENYLCLYGNKIHQIDFEAANVVLPALKTINITIDHRLRQIQRTSVLIIHLFCPPQSRDFVHQSLTTINVRAEEFGYGYYLADIVTRHNGWILTIKVEPNWNTHHCRCEDASQPLLVLERDPLCVTDFVMTHATHECTFHE
jgi:hypothetical protein